MTTTEMGGNANTNNNSNNPNSSSSIASGTATGSDDEKSHTFRKRRLSLSRHNIAPETAAPSATAAVATAASPLEARGDSTDPPVPEVTTGEKKRKKDESESDQKAHTFRKRRLSVTLKSPASLLEDEEEEEEEEEDNDKKELELPTEADCEKDKPQQEANNDTNVTDREEPNAHTRPRRASDASAASLASSTQAAQDALKVRTLHAGEIVNQLHRSPPSPAVDPTTAANSSAAAVNNNNSSSSNEPHVLYRLSRPPSSATLLHVPFAAEEETHAASAPKWKKRITRKHDEDERKLPFPRDVVGTYSCHGVEPVYDSDYENNMGDDEEGEGQDEENLLHGPGPETWTEDISGDVCPSNSTNNQQSRRLMPTPDTGKPTNLTAAAQEEPKPTTAAKINQDRGGVAFPYGNCARTALFAAYDGHGQGGELVSQFALHEVQSRLEKRPEFHTDLEKAFKDTFLAVDESLQHEPLIEPLYAGTTACVALLRDNVLTVANAGDSRAVVARRNVVNDTATTANNDNATTPTYQAIDLTVDQNPDLPAERQRIETMGGFVSPPPEPGLSARVWLDEGFSQIGLAMARSIGDHAVARVGVIAEPVVTTHTVEPDDEFLIIATDGVWEFLSSETAVEIVGANLARGATKATQALIEAAAARWHDEEGDYRDDITALVIRLPELWKQGRL